MDEDADFGGDVVIDASGEMDIVGGDLAGQEETSSATEQEVPATAASASSSSSSSAASRDEDVPQDSDKAPQASVAAEPASSDSFTATREAFYHVIWTNWCSSVPFVATNTVWEGSCSR